MRCDETYPSCLNCKKAGRHCSGVVRVPLNEYGLYFPPPMTSNNFRPSYTNSLSQQDLAYLDLFRRHFVNSVMGHAGHTGRLGLKELVLQAVHTDEAVSHAAIAFTARICASKGTGPRLLQGTSADEHSISANHSALVHYGKCLSQLRNISQQTDNRSINVALICALLCVCFELRMEDPVYSLHHLEHGLRVLQSRKPLGNSLTSTQTSLCNQRG